MTNFAAVIDLKILLVMKKIVLCFMAMTLSLFIVSCGDGNNSNSSVGDNGGKQGSGNPTSISVDSNRPTSGHPSGISVDSSGHHPSGISVDSSGHQPSRITVSGGSPSGISVGNGEVNPDNHVDMNDVRGGTINPNLPDMDDVRDGYKKMK